MLTCFKLKSGLTDPDEGNVFHINNLFPLSPPLVTDIISFVPFVHTPHGQDAFVSINIYNIAGQLIDQVFSGNLSGRPRPSIINPTVPP